MNSFSLLMLPVVLTMVACETMNPPISSGSFDPLGPPGTGLKTPSNNETSLIPGQFVTASIPNTPFYKEKPKDNQDADKLLTVGTAMKVIAVDSNFVNVELDSGETGFVPSVMINIGNEESQEYLQGDGMFPSYPPLPEGDGAEPLPIIDPNGLPPGDAVPMIIDPNAPIPDHTAPITLDPVPDLKEATPPVEAAVEEVKEKAKEKEIPEE